MSFTIISGKEGNTPKKSLFLVAITAPDGDQCYLTTAGYYGQPYITYNGTQYLARIAKNDIEALMASGPQGYATVPSFRLTIADGDKVVWANHFFAHPPRGAQVTLTAILWDVVANQYSTDALQWSFIGGSASHDYATGNTTLDTASAINFVRLKVPSIPIEYRCPWDFPTTFAQRQAALNDPTSVYYQCGYSADVSGGIGNLDGTGHAFTSCDLTRSSPSDPSVGCMARLGNAATTSVAADGDLSHDKAGNYTARFGGVTWLAPSQYSGRAYLSGQKTFGFNQPNTALPGSYYNWVYGTQWVNCQVLAPAGDPNSLRSEAAVCVAAFGQANVMQLLVNGVMVPQGNSDPLFTWRYINQGGRSGALNGDTIYSMPGHSAMGDPHGSVCVIEFVVPAQLAQPGSVPTVQALVTGPPILNVYTIDHITSGVVTFTGPNWSCAGNPPFRVIITGNSNAALNGSFTLSNWTGGSPGTITLAGTSNSGTGGAVFFFANPDLFDTGGSIATNPSGQYTNLAGPACNLAFAALDLMTWGNISTSQIDPVSWYNAAQICATQLSYKAADGSSQSHAQFKASLALRGDQRQTLAQVLTAVRNSGNLMIGQSTNGGLIQCFVKQTLADQQPSAVSGSNDATARTSLHADGTTGTGYYAYLFNESNIDKNSFRVTTQPIESTPNTVSIQFQDEYNGYQADSLTQIDPVSYAYSGNQEIQVPIPINACPNFDQGMRVANVALAEALWGNWTNTPSGTLNFEFTTNMRVIHLTSRLGFICGLTWQTLGIGTSAPQPIRVISIKPLDADGEKWQVKASWHQDVWYTYAYGQDPTPFQSNPLLNQPYRPPYPWQPGNTIQPDLVTNFSVNVNPQNQVVIMGQQPINIQQSIEPAAVPLQATTSSTGGALNPGTYYLAVSSNGTKGPVSQIITAVVPSGTGTNTININNVFWPNSAAPAVGLYMGTTPFNMTYQGDAAGNLNYTTSNLDGHGNPGSFTVAAMVQYGGPVPDLMFNRFLIRQTPIIHGGVWGDVVTSSNNGITPTLTFANASWSANQWVGYTLVTYYRPGGGPIGSNQPSATAVVTASTTNTLTLSNNHIHAGDVVVMRAKANNISSNTIGDANFSNSYNGNTGLTVNGEAGNLVWIVAGTGAAQAPKTIASNTSTVLTIAGKWDITPDSTSQYIVIAPTSQDTVTKAVVNDGSGSITAAVGSVPLPLTGQSMLMQVATADADGNTAPMQWQPFREMYLPAPGTVVTVSSNYTAGLTDEHIMVNTSSGNITVNLTQGAMRTKPLTIKKISSDSNSVIVNGLSGEQIDGSSTQNLTAFQQSITVVGSN